MSGPIQYEWNRVRHLVTTKLPGRHEWRIVYVASLDASTILNVWRQSSYWKWVVIGVASNPLVLRHGEAPTMHEAKVRAEAALTIGEQQPRQTEAFPKGKSHDLPF